MIGQSKRSIIIDIKKRDRSSTSTITLQCFAVTSVCLHLHHAILKISESKTESYSILTF